MKKILVVLIGIVLALTLIGCVDQEERISEETVEATLTEEIIEEDVITENIITENIVSDEYRQELEFNSQTNKFFL